MDVYTAAEDKGTTAAPDSSAVVRPPTTPANTGTLRPPLFDPSGDLCLVGGINPHDNGLPQIKHAYHVECPVRYLTDVISFVQFKNGIRATVTAPSLGEEACHLHLHLGKVPGHWKAADVIAEAEEELRTSVELRAHQTILDPFRNVEKRRDAACYKESQGCGNQKA